MATPRIDASCESLDRMQWQADPLADELVESVVGPWEPAQGLHEGGDEYVHANRLLSIANADAVRGLGEIAAAWSDNRDIATWQAPPTLDAKAAAAIRGYLDRAAVPPPWLCPRKLARAEQIFAELGALTITVLSCASLPETYVIPDLAAVLRITGQLEKHTEYRIRATGATLLPLMVAGGLTSPEGGAVAQLLKTRLTHALIRHLILRGDPAAAARSAREASCGIAAALVPAIEGHDVAGIRHPELVSAGWALGEDGLPCNQEEMAYTLLTFGYVSLRSLERLGLTLSPSDTEAYLHLWNVAGHYLGLDHALMARTLGEAERLFAAIQQRGRRHHSRKYRVRPDPRADLGDALMKAMERSLASRALRLMPAMTTRYLCGRETSRDLGLDRRPGRAWYSAFVVTLLSLRLVDRAASLAWPRFSILRFLGRVLGYRFMLRLLALDQASAPALNPSLQKRFVAVLRAWSRDPHAPPWMNGLENRLTGGYETAPP